MTKGELREYLKAGGLMGDAFDFGPGQECEIFKADYFEPGDEIIYIPDLSLNTIRVWEPAADDDAIEEMVGNCYTGNDFIEECGGDAEKAERLFWYCDWQHPSSAMDEGAVDDDEEDEG